MSTSLQPNGKILVGIRAAAAQRQDMLHRYILVHKSGGVGMAELMGVDMVGADLFCRPYTNPGLDTLVGTDQTGRRDRHSLEICCALCL